MYSTKQIHQFALLALSLSSQLQAGEILALPEEQAEHGYSYCDALVNLGKIYENPKNPFIEEFRFDGRLHYQAAWLEGNDINGREFNNSYEEVRRARIGINSKFLSVFNIKVAANLVDDSRTRTTGDLDWGYENLDQATLGIDLKKAFSISQVDKMLLTYGVQKFDLGEEAFNTSNKIPTVERTGISNKTYLDGIRPTGLTLEAVKGPWDILLGLFSTEENPEFDAKWDQGFAYQGTIGYQATEQLKYVADFIYNDSGLDQENHWDYKWASSVRAEYRTARWAVISEAFYGDNGDEQNGNTNPDRQGEFWAFIFTPTYWVVQDRLESVFQYQYAGSSESEGIQTSSRYLRRSHAAGVDVNNGRGDSHQYLYAGLNYLFCDHNSKVMCGIQYDNLETPGGRLDGTTLWLAYRTYF